jgi:hypothetical protein
MNINFLVNAGDKPEILRFIVYSVVHIFSNVTVLNILSVIVENFILLLVLFKFNQDHVIS